MKLRVPSQLSGRQHFLAASIALVAVSCMLAACAPAASSPPSTSAAAAPAQSTTASKPVAEPARVSEPTNPSATPAAKVDYPVSGKTITQIIPFTAGGAADIASRVMGPLMEKELQVPIQLVNRPDAGGQSGLTDLAKAKPDGYTFGQVNIPTAITIYRDEERRTIFGRKDLQPIGSFVVDPFFLAVKADSPYKTLEDFVKGAKANPGKVTVGVGGGKLSPPHLGLLLLSKVSEVKFATVIMNGSAPCLTGLLGGHTESCMASGGTFASQVKSGEIRLLGVMDSQESEFYPGVKTFKAQGYDANMLVQMGFSVPAGTPQEIASVLSSAFKKSLDSPEVKKRMDALGMPMRYADAPTFGAQWDKMENEIVPLMPLANE